MVSYATGRATLRWDPAKVDLPALARRIAALGYRPRPLGGDTSPPWPPAPDGIRRHRGHRHDP